MSLPVSLVHEKPGVGDLDIQAAQQRRRPNLYPFSWYLQGHHRLSVGQSQTFFACPCHHSAWTCTQTRQKQSFLTITWPLPLAALPHVLVP